MSLRKWKPDYMSDKEEDQVLVFGYQCKLFRDDEKAMYIDRGKHLIPWMGESSLMIDRYDGRGHLSDLRAYDAEFVDSSRYHLSDKELALEKACDEERYLELHTDIAEQKVYEEEEMKRLYEAVGEGYAAVGFNYDTPSSEAAQNDQDTKEAEEEDDEPYRPIPELEVPKGVNLPKTMKQHAIIEKTANFICTQGAQMEIVIATKQKNNPQFNFLNHDHELNYYYRHIVKKIQKGRYQARPQEYYVRKKKDEEGQASPEKPVTPIDDSPPKDVLASIRDRLPQIQVHNTAYGRLLQKLQQHVAPSPPGSPAQNDNSRSSTPSELEKPATKPPPTQNKEPSKPPPDHGKPTANTDDKFERYDEEDEEAYRDWYHHKDYDHEKYAQYYNYYFSYALSIGYIGPDAEAYGAHYAHEQVVKELIESRKKAKKEKAVVATVSRPKDPPSELKLIIDKMASYVLRNGEDFEQLMRGKKDQRFSFLEPDDLHNPYYLYVKSITKVDLEEEGEGEEQGDKANGKEAKPSRVGVSFTIRPKDSTDVNGLSSSSSKAGSLPKRGSTASLPSVAGLPSWEAETSEDKDPEGHKKLAALIGIGAGGYSSGETSEEEEEEVGEVDGDKSDAASDSDSNSKMASEQLMNRLALAAREVLVQNKEEEPRNKKDERKRKVAMFKAMLKTSASSAAITSSTTDGVQGAEAMAPSFESAPNLAELDSSPDSTPQREGSLVRRVRTSSTSSSSSSSSTSSKSTKRNKTSSKTSSPPPQEEKAPSSKASPTQAGATGLEIISRWSRSPSQTKVKPGSLSSMLLADREKKSSRTRARSRSRSRHRHRHHQRRSRHRRKSPALPSAYSMIRRSISPKSSPPPARRYNLNRHNSRDRDRKRRSRSRNGRGSKRRHRSRSRHKKRAKSRSRSGSTSPKRKRSKKSKRSSQPKKKKKREVKRRLKSSSSDSTSKEPSPAKSPVKFSNTSEDESEKLSSSPDIAKESQAQIEKLKGLLEQKKEELMNE